MEPEYGGRFTRQLRRIRDQQILRSVQRKIEELKLATSLGDVAGVKKLHSGRNFFRIRIGAYRLGLEIEDNKVNLLRFRHRSDFYRSFP